MELAWLEDFLAIVECGRFSRAAETRHVTQPALSRRIQALEEWIGTPLFHRTTQSVTLTPAGDSFRHTAEEIVRRVAAGRSEALERARGTAETLRFAATNALSLHFFPGWLRAIEARLPFEITLNLVSNHMEGCERLMVQGQIQFLLCHDHPQVESVLRSGDFVSARVGCDVLVPVSAPNSAQDPAPLHALPGTAEAPVSSLSFRPETALSRVLAVSRSSSPLKAHLRSAFSSQVAKLLVTMALERRGMGWLPRTLIEEHLASGHLVRAGDPAWDIPIEIRVFRPRARQSDIAERFWSEVETASPSDAR